MAATAVQVRQCSQQGNIVTSTKFVEDIVVGAATVQTIDADAADNNGQNYLVVLSDAPIWVEIAAAPDGTDRQWLCLANTPLVIPVTRDMHGHKIAYDDI